VAAKLSSTTSVNLLRMDFSNLSFNDHFKMNDSLLLNIWDFIKGNEAAEAVR
jgi:hypothetical protein